VRLAAAWRRRGFLLAAARQCDVAWRRCGGGGSISGSGGSATARRWRQLGGTASDGDGDKEGDGEHNNQI